MPEPLYILVTFVLTFIDIISWAMCIRAVLGWFIADNGGKLMRFLYVVTEPAIMPTRKLFYKLNWFQRTPFDMAYMFTYLELFLIQFLISSFM